MNDQDNQPLATYVKAGSSGLGNPGSNTASALGSTSIGENQTYNHPQNASENSSQFTKPDAIPSVNTMPMVNSSTTINQSPPSQMPSMSPGNMTPVIPFPTNSPKSPSSNQKKSGGAKKIISAILLLILFIGSASTGIFIAQRQFYDPGPVAPTAPRSEPQADTREITIPSETCDISWTVGPISAPICEYKRAYTDFESSGNATLITEQMELELGDKFVYKIVVSFETGFHSQILFVDELPAKVDFVEHSNNTPDLKYDPVTHTASMDLYAETNGVNFPIEFMVEVNDKEYENPVVNEAVILAGTRAEPEGSRCIWPITIGEAPPPSPTPTPTPTPSPTPTPTPTPTPSPTPTPPVFTCNGSCSSDADCQTVNAGYVCSAAHGNVCRLDSNRESTTCQPRPEEYACNSACTTNEQCQTVNPNYICSSAHGNVCRLNSYPSASNCLPPTYTPPPPTVGCNAICTSNADCAANNHICYTTDDGTNRCRLENYVNSDTCTLPPVTQQTYEQPVEQVVLPEELPLSGPEDWITWLKIGLITIGIGAAILLLL